MEESKTLIDQLREMVELSIINDQHPTVHADAIVGHLCVNRSEARELFTTIADRIEREYLPRPRFEDGEPVQFGDKFYSDEHGKTYKATMFVIYADGSFRVNQAGCNACQYEQGERVKRPEPEVLDADGVPIIVGDVVYFVDSAEAFDVLGIESDRDEPVHIGRKDRTSTDAWVSPGDLTHKQPDTLDSIEEDAFMDSITYCNKYGLIDSRCNAEEGDEAVRHCVDCGLSCETRMVKHLLHRQREVLERGQK